MTGRSLIRVGLAILVAGTALYMIRAGQRDAMNRQAVQRIFAPPERAATGQRRQPQIDGVRVRPSRQTGQ